MRLAKHVDPPGVRRTRREHLAGDELDVARPVITHLRGHDVRPEIGHLVGDLSGQAQRPLLVGDGEAVAGLHLDCRRALGAHLRDASSERGPQVVITGLAGRSDRHPDAAPVVDLACHPSGELRRPVPREDEVSVTVHETRCDTTPFDVDDRVRGGCRRSGPDPGDAPGVDDECVVGAGADAPFARAVAGDELTDVGDERAHADLLRAASRVMTRWINRAATRAVR